MTHRPITYQADIDRAAKALVKQGVMAEDLCIEVLPGGGVRVHARKAGDVVALEDDGSEPDLNKL